MKITGDLTDGAIQAELGARLARACLDRNMTQAELAREAGVSKPTLERLEAGRPARLTTVLRVLRVLGLADNLDVLVPETGPSPMERLRRQGSTRRRATPKPPAARDEQWVWGDERRPEGG